jgi:hypothetical protein
MTWGGWADTLSGLEKYQYEVHELGHNGQLLGEQQGEVIINPKDLTITATGVRTDQF